MARRGRIGIEVLRKSPVKTFEERKAENPFVRENCDISSLPQRFIHQTNRLARIYNEIVFSESPDFDKLERVIDLARETCYKDYGCE